MELIHNTNESKPQENYLRLNRIILDGELGLAKNNREFNVYMNLLIRAAWREHGKLKVGQVMIGYSSFGDQIGFSSKMVRNSLTKLIKWGLITKESNDSGTIITLTNYSYYQGVEGAEKDEENVVADKNTFNWDVMLINYKKMFNRPRKSSFTESEKVMIRKAANKHGKKALINTMLSLYNWDFAGSKDYKFVSVEYMTREKTIAEHKDIKYSAEEVAPVRPTPLEVTGIKDIPMGNATAKEQLEWSHVKHLWDKAQADYEARLKQWKLTT